MRQSAALARRAQATLHSKARPFLDTLAASLSTFCREQGQGAANQQGGHPVAGGTQLELKYRA